MFDPAGDFAVEVDCHIATGEDGNLTPGQGAPNDGKCLSAALLVTREVVDSHGTSGDRIGASIKKRGMKTWPP